MPLKACPYCGRIHPKGFDCGHLPKRGQKNTTEEKRFRSSTAWTRKSIRIRERDHYMCVYCMQHDNHINTEEIEVHHIISLKQDYNRRLDDDNLISLCREHHEAAEVGVIKQHTLLSMAAKQEDLYANGLPCL